MCEEVARFVLNDRRLTYEFKKARHKIDGLGRKLHCARGLIEARQSTTDVGKPIYINELKRKNIGDIFWANIQRAKESARVLEEFSKLKNTLTAIGFKEIRYGLYQLEKKAARKIAPLYHSR